MLRLRVTSDRQLLSQALDAFFFVARSSARPGEVVRVHLRLAAEASKATELGIPILEIYAPLRARGSVVAIDFVPFIETDVFEEEELQALLKVARQKKLRRAEATLDVQYYHLADDASGRWLLRALPSSRALRPMPGRISPCCWAAQPTNTR